MLLIFICLLLGFAYKGFAAPPPGPKTSVAANFQIQGSGVTPFDINNQNLVCNAFSDSVTSVSRADITVRYFTSDDEKIPNFSDSRRKLLSSEAASIGSRKLLDSITGLQPQATFKNTVYLTLFFNAGSPGRTQSVENDIKASLQETGPYSVVPVQQALQSYGQSGWSLQLLSSGNVDPTQPLAVELLCNEKFGSFCLDGSGLSAGGVKGIIAAGCIFLVLVPAILCVLIDLRRRSGKMGEIASLPETPKTPMQKATNSITQFLKTSFAAIKPSGMSSTNRHTQPIVENTLPRPAGPVPGAPTAQITTSNNSYTKSGEKVEASTTEKAESIPSQKRSVSRSESKRQSEVNTKTTNKAEIEPQAVAGVQAKSGDSSQPQLPPIKTKVEK